jgi:hypothetical protein
VHVLRCKRQYADAIASAADPLRAEPRFQALLRQMNLPQ